MAQPRPNLSFSSFAASLCDTALNVFAFVGLGCFFLHCDGKRRNQPGFHGMTAPRTKATVCLTALTPAARPAMSSFNVAAAAK